MATTLCPISSNWVCKSSLLSDVSPTVSCFKNPSPARPFFSLSFPAPEIPYLCLPCYFCHVITSISYASCFSLEPPTPPKNLQFQPVFPFSGILLPGDSACQKKRGDFWLITPLFGTSKPRHGEEPQPGVWTFPFGLLNLLTKWEKFGINPWKTSEINFWVPEILTPWSSSQLRLSKPRIVHFSQFMRFIFSLSGDADRKMKLVCFQSISLSHSCSYNKLKCSIVNTWGEKTKRHEQWMVMYLLQSSCIFIYISLSSRPNSKGGGPPPSFQADGEFEVN